MKRKKVTTLLQYMEPPEIKRSGSSRYHKSASPLPDWAVEAPSNTTPTTTAMGQTASSSRTASSGLSPARSPRPPKTVKTQSRLSWSKVAKTAMGRKGSQGSPKTRAVVNEDLEHYIRQSNRLVHAYRERWFQLARSGTLARLAPDTPPVALGGRHVSAPARTSRSGLRLTILHRAKTNSMSQDS